MMAKVESRNTPPVRVVSFLELFSLNALPLALDVYQRPYVWIEDKVLDLAKDLEEYAKDAKPSQDYYMGTLLLHESSQEQKRFIIDGQQRLTTLCILHRVLTGVLPVGCELSYRSPESWKNIRTSADTLKKQAFPWVTADLLKHILFTVITVDSEDLAFTFFDTQNSRGVRLNATDLLKAFHLRAIGGDSRVPLQKTCARRWEALQASKSEFTYGTDFAPTLFRVYLWRARCWVGNKGFGPDVSDEQLIYEFQRAALCFKDGDAAEVPLYRAAGNRWATALTLQPDQGYQITGAKFRISNNPAYLPFAVRQPISAGVGFFLYAEKYATLASELVTNGSPSREVEAFRVFYTMVVSPLSIYLRELFLLASVMYVDQFGQQKLLRFALWLDYALGAIRLKKRYIFKQAPVIFLTERPVNFLDVLANAFRPEDAIEYLSKLPQPSENYPQTGVDLNNVQKTYLANVRKYYRKSGEDEMSKRGNWINDKLKELHLS